MKTITADELYERMRKNIICPVCSLKLDECKEKYGKEHKRFW